MPIPSPCHSSTHSFNLWQPIKLSAQVQNTLAPFEDRQGVDPQAILYWQPTHGEHANFCQHPDFAIYKTQVKELLDQLVEYCQCNGINEAKTNKLKQSLNTFYQRRFEENYFSTTNEQIDTYAIPALYQFQRLLSVSTLPPLQIALRITELTHILMVCTGGITSKLNEWVRDFALDSGGMITKLWEYKETMVQTLLMEQTHTIFGHQEHYFNNQVHYVNGAWNSMYATLGLPYRQDPFAYKDTPDIVLKNWMTSIKHAVTPERCIALMAETILGSFREQFISNGQDSSKIQEIIDKIEEAFGLTSNTLSAWSFVKYDENNDQYSPQPNSTLITLDLLAAFYKGGLLIKPPWQIVQYRLSTNGDTLSLYKAGADNEILWCVWNKPNDLQGWETSCQRTLLDVDGVIGFAKHTDVFRDLSLASSILRQVIQNDAAHLERVPFNLLDCMPILLEVLHHLAPEKRDRYIQEYKLELTQQSKDIRLSMADKLMGISDAATELVYSHCYKGRPYLLLKEQYQKTSRLQRWIRNQQVTAINATCQQLRKHPNDIRNTKKNQPDTLTIFNGNSASPILCEAIRSGNPQVVAACINLLKVFIDQIDNTNLIDILLAKDASGIPALCYALASDKTEVLRAYMDILSDDKILQRITADELAKLLLAKDLSGTPALCYALANGKTETVKALLDILKVDHVLEKIPAANLAELILAKDLSGTPALYFALSNGKTETVKALLDLLKVDHVLEKIPAANLAELLFSKDKTGNSALYFAIRNGHIEAAMAVLTAFQDTRIRQHLPEEFNALHFLLAMDKDGQTGLYFALTNHKPFLLAIQGIFEKVDISFKELRKAIEDQHSLKRKHAPNF